MSYRGFDIKEMTLDDVRDLIGSADDGVDHQIRVADNGRVFLAETVGAKGLKGIQFRFETFDAGNGYVGHDAAENYQYIYQIYLTLKKNWENGYAGYVDIWENEE